MQIGLTHPTGLQLLLNEHDGIASWRHAQVLHPTTALRSRDDNGGAEIVRWAFTRRVGQGDRWWRTCLLRAGRTYGVQRPDLRVLTSTSAPSATETKARLLPLNDCLSGSAVDILRKSFPASFPAAITLSASTPALFIQPRGEVGHPHRLSCLSAP